MNFLITIIINIILYPFRLLLFHNPNGKSKGDTTITEGAGAPDCLALECAQLLEKNGLSYLMLEDFSFRNLPAKKEVTDLDIVKKKLQAMSAELAAHLHVKELPVYPRIVEDKNAKCNAGEYQPGANKFININIWNYFVPIQLAAILCHEYTHYFMDTNHLDDWSDRPLNERRTDVMAGMIGFSNIMVEGYHVMTKASFQVFSWEIEGSGRVGYLNAAEHSIVRKTLVKIRKDIRSGKMEYTDSAGQAGPGHTGAGQKTAGQTGPGQTASGQKTAGQAGSGQTAGSRRTGGQTAPPPKRITARDLNNHIEGAKAMIMQVKSMQAAQGPPPIRDKRKMAEIQKVYLALENGEINGILASCQKALAGNEDEIRQADAQIMDVCGELYLIISAY